MKNFSICDLERFSGIKAHTLRTWERRYGLLRPQRDNGFRFYSPSELKEVLNLALLTQNGFRISTLAEMTAEQRQTKAEQLNHRYAKQAKAVHCLILAMYEMSVTDFEAELRSSFLSWPVLEVAENVIYPFLERAELLWHGKRLTEEHLAVTVIRKKLLWAIETLRPGLKSETTIVLFLPDTAQLDLGLLYMHLRLEICGCRVVYLGNDVSPSNLEAIYEKVRPQFFYTYSAGRNRSHLPQLFSFLGNACHSQL